MAHNDFTVDDLKDIVAGALSTILSRASERGLKVAVMSNHVEADRWLKKRKKSLPYPLHCKQRQGESIALI